VEGHAGRQRFRDDAFAFGDEFRSESAAGQFGIDSLGRMARAGAGGADGDTSTRGKSRNGCNAGTERIVGVSRGGQAGRTPAPFGHREERRARRRRGGLNLELQGGAEARTWRLSSPGARAGLQMAPLVPPPGLGQRRRFASPRRLVVHEPARGSRPLARGGTTRGKKKRQKEARCGGENGERNVLFVGAGGVTRHHRGGLDPIGRAAAAHASSLARQRLTRPLGHPRRRNTVVPIAWTGGVSLVTSLGESERGYQPGR